MSEPYSALIKLQITRSDLVRWLDTSPADPDRWTDWRDIGGQWYLGSGVKDLADASDGELSEPIAEAKEQLSSCSTVREALRGLLQNDSPDNAIRIAYDPAEGEFIAGALFYDENLVPFIAFLALVRGSEDHLAPSGSGIALIHDFVFASNAVESTVTALAIGPGQTSRLLVGNDRQSAVTTFQGMVDTWLGNADGPPPSVDQLDELR